MSSAFAPRHLLPSFITRLLDRLSGRTIATGLVLSLLFYLVLGPVLMLLLSSFKSTVGQLPFEPDVPWTFNNYLTVFFSSGTWITVFNTLAFSAGSLAFSFAVSIGLAWLTERTDMPGKGIAFVLIIAAVGMPTVIAAIAWVLLLNPATGLINVAFRGALGLVGDGPFDVYTIPGLVFVQGLALVPITYLLVAAAFRTSDAVMEDAASTSGASLAKTLRRITLPLLTPALLSALVYQFVSVVESFDIPLVIGLRAGIHVLSTEVYVQAAPAGGLPNFGLSSAYSLLLLVLAIGPLLLYNAAISRSERFATIGGHEYKTRQIKLGPWRWIAAGMVGLLVVVVFILPAVVMIWTSLQPFYALPSAESLARLSLDAFAEVVSSERVHDAVLNTFILAVVTAAATMTLSLMISWILVRTRSRFRFVVDLLAFTPHAMPGVIIGLSVLLIYLILPIPIYGSIWIIAVALTTQWISISTRLMTAGIAQIQRELEEAAETSGASWLRVIRRIVLPLVWPAFLNGFLLIFLLAIKNLTMPLILYSPDSVVLSTLVWTFWDNGDTASTAALGVIMVLVTLILAVVLRRSALTGALRNA